jgi:hypothetical protein
VEVWWWCGGGGSGSSGGGDGAGVVVAVLVAVTTKWCEYVHMRVCKTVPVNCVTPFARQGSDNPKRLHFAKGDIADPHTHTDTHAHHHHHNRHNRHCRHPLLVAVAPAG